MFRPRALSEKQSMNKLSFLSIILLAGLLSCKNKTAETVKPMTAENGIYAYKVEGLKGDTIDFAAFKGKKIMVVNTASECSYTYQYEGLEALYQQYKEKLVIVGFPSNDFGSQEPGSNEEIEEFCRENYGVSSLPYIAGLPKRNSTGTAAAR